MMKNGSYQSDLRKFWENRKQAREERDRQLAELPFSDKVAIVKSLQKDAKAIENATMDSIGLRVKSPDAVNESSLYLLLDGSGHAPSFLTNHIKDAMFKIDMKQTKDKKLAK